MQIRKLGVVALGVVLSFTILSGELVAQQGPGPETRLAIVVNGEGPLADESDVIRDVLRTISEKLDESNRYDVISARQLSNAEADLGFEIDEDSSPRQIREFADEVNADYVLLFTIESAGPEQIRIEAQAFNSRGQEVFDENTQRLPVDEEALIARATLDLLEEMLDEV